MPELLTIFKEQEVLDQFSKALEVERFKDVKNELPEDLDEEVVNDFMDFINKNDKEEILERSQTKMDRYV